MKLEAQRVSEYIISQMYLEISFVVYLTNEIK